MNELFLELLNRGIITSLLIVFICVLRIVFTKSPKWVNCVIWGVVAAKLIVPVSIECTYSIWSGAAPLQTSVVVNGEEKKYIPTVDSQLEIVNKKINPILVDTFDYEESESIAPLQLYMKIAQIIWVVGISVLLINAIVGALRIRRKVEEAVLYQDNIWLCDNVKSPFIYGIFKPRVYLPSGLEGK